MPTSTRQKPTRGEFRPYAKHSEGTACRAGKHLAEKMLNRGRRAVQKADAAKRMPFSGVVPDKGLRNKYLEKKP